MGETKIEWTDYTFNPWIGCARVSKGCVHCYAEALAKRFGTAEWGVDKARVRTSAEYWGKPAAWNKAAAAAGQRRRVFCASMADVFEERPELDAWRAELWRLIEQTPALDWLLLTKRPQNVMAMVPEAWRAGLPPNVWVGASVEDQEAAQARIPALAKVPARVRFLSAEPLLGPVNLERLLRPDGWRTKPFHWVIVGGESGPGARAMDPQWAHELVRQCNEAGVTVFMKQMGSAWAAGKGGDRKGAQPTRWPQALRVREFPYVR